MAEQGMYGFRQNNIDKLSYNSQDSVPDVLGRNMVKFCLEHTKEELCHFCDNLTMVDGDDYPDKKQINAMSTMGLLENDEAKGFQHVRQWNDVLLLTQGHLDLAYALQDDDIGFFMVDGEHFMINSYLCHYMYIINLDNDTFEFWLGNQTRPNSKNRYGHQRTMPYKGSGYYYPCKLVAEIPLKDVLCTGKYSVDYVVRYMEDIVSSSSNSRSG